MIIHLNKGKTKADQTKVLFSDYKMENCIQDKSWLQATKKYRT